MSLLGFMLGTIFSVLLILVGALKVYQPKKLIAITLGISIGTYLIFGKLLGIYLPLGQLLDIGM
jgi:Mg/Co/Ni transporter MgtE